MRSEFLQKNAHEWHIAINNIFDGNPPQSANWERLDSIISALEAICRNDNLNYTLLPGGGGQEICNVKLSLEHNCLEFISNGASYLCKPEKLYFEYFPEHPWESFFFLDTQGLSKTDVYETLNESSEELLRLPNGDYYDRNYYDQGFIDCDDEGNEIPLPEEAEIVVRKLQGKFLILAKSSSTNLMRLLDYDKHSTKSPQEIRRIINNTLDQNTSPPR